MEPDLLEFLIFSVVLFIAGIGSLMSVRKLDRTNYIIQEEYPNLKAQGTVFEVTQQMHAIEEKIAHGRRNYNETVREYNDNIKAFPRVLIAYFYGFAEHTFFSTPEEKARMPEFEVTGME